MKNQEKMIALGIGILIAVVLVICLIAGSYRCIKHPEEGKGRGNSINDEFSLQWYMNPANPISPMRRRND